MQKIFKDYFDDFKDQYDEKYAQSYWNYRIDRISEVVEEFLLTRRPLTERKKAKHSTGGWSS